MFILINKSAKHWVALDGRQHHFLSMFDKEINESRSKSSRVKFSRKLN